MSVLVCSSGTISKHSSVASEYLKCLGFSMVVAYEKLY